MKFPCVTRFALVCPEVTYYADSQNSAKISADTANHPNFGGLLKNSAGKRRMRTTLTQALVDKLRWGRPAPAGISEEFWGDGTTQPNYLIRDLHRDAPSGFCLRVNKKNAVYLMDKTVNNKNLKIPVGLASGKKGSEQVISLDRARKKALSDLARAEELGASPKQHQKQKRADQLTFGEVWDMYENYLRTRAEPAKENSMLAVKKARDKFEDWEELKVVSLQSQMIVDRFDKHFFTLKHPTAAEAMARWASAAIDKAIELEAIDAMSEGREPRLVHNPFFALKALEKFRTAKQLEKSYKAKGIRNPLSFEANVTPFLDALWKYRSRNPLAADFIALSLLWGLRLGEAATFQWKERVPADLLSQTRWIDLNAGIGCISDGKNGNDHEFPIGPCALALLKIRKSMLSPDTPWVFPTESASAKRGYYTDPSCAMASIQRLANEGLTPDRQIKVLRGHDIRRTFGRACEMLGFTDRQTKRLLGHAIAGGETVGRYTEPEWKEIKNRMIRLEKLILGKTSHMYDALRPNGELAISEKGFEIPAKSNRKSRAKSSFS